MTEIGNKSVMLDLLSLPLHPFLFALYPALALLSENIDQVSISDSYRSLMVVFLVAGILTILFRLVLGSWQGAAVLSTLALILFFSYGHVYTALKTFSVAGVLIGRHRYLFPTWVVLFILGLVLSRRRVPGHPRASGVLNAVAAVLLLLPLVRITSNQIRSEAGQGALSSDRSATSTREGYPPAEELPDIYYIVPDSYVRADVLLERYGYDNMHFVSSLQERGFFVAKLSRSNYAWTHQSLSSSLNMDYLQEFIAELTPGGYRIDLDEHLKNSRVRRLLEELGYSTVAFATGWKGTELYDADYLLTPDMTRLDVLKDRGFYNDFEGMLIHSSALKILADLDSIQNTPVAAFLAERAGMRFDVHRETILSIFKNLQSTPYIPGPKFVFAHIISPHRPYLFEPNGEGVAQNGPFTLAEIDELPVDQEAALYRDQLIFITSMLDETVEEILRRSERPVIIILQADHGFAAGLDWEKPEEAELLARMSILNAYLLPDSCRNQLYPTVTPVNTFRIVLNCIGPRNYPLLGDRSYVGYNHFVPLSEIQN